MTSSTWDSSESRAPGQQWSLLRSPEVLWGNGEPQQLESGAWPAAHTILSPALSTLCTHTDPSRTHPGSLLVTGRRRERGPGLLPSGLLFLREKPSSCSSTWTDFLRTRNNHCLLFLGRQTNASWGWHSSFWRALKWAPVSVQVGREADSDRVVLTFLRQREKNTSNRGFSSGRKGPPYDNSANERPFSLHGGCQTLVTGCL